MISRFCGKCGTSNTGQNSFCLQCGQQLETTNQPADSFRQPAAFQPSPPTAPPFELKNPPPNFSSPFQPNFGSPNSFTPPNNFQSPASSSAMTLSQNTQKKGIGGKILSALGALAVGLYVLLKGSLILWRLGSFGGIGLILVVGLIIAVFVVISLVRKM